MTKVKNKEEIDYINGQSESDARSDVLLTIPLQKKKTW